MMANKDQFSTNVLMIPSPAKWTVLWFILHVGTLQNMPLASGNENKLLVDLGVNYSVTNSSPFATLNCCNHEAKSVTDKNFINILMENDDSQSTIQTTRGRPSQAETSLSVQETSNLPVHHTDGNSSPASKSELFSPDILQCILTNSSFNFTGEEELNISYFQDKQPVHSNGHESVTASSVNNFTHNSSGFSHVPKSPDTASPSEPISSDNSTGFCTIFLEAPQGRVLSILFLNQTCSHDNQVRVEDTHGRRSSVLNGCNLWKAPGYDVTTSNTSATIVIDLGDLAVFYRLEINVLAVVSPRKDGVLTRYVSPVLGQIRSDKGSSYSRTCHGHPLSKTTCQSTTY